MFPETLLYKYFYMEMYVRQEHVSFRVENIYDYGLCIVDCKPQIQLKVELITRCLFY